MSEQRTLELLTEIHIITIIIIIQISGTGTGGIKKKYNLYIAFTTPQAPATNQSRYELEPAGNILKIGMFYTSWLRTLVDGPRELLGYVEL